jgi:hypothetical protein
LMTASTLQEPIVKLFCLFAPTLGGKRNKW